MKQSILRPNRVVTTQQHLGWRLTLGIRFLFLLLFPLLMAGGCQSESDRATSQACSRIESLDGKITYENDPQGGLQTSVSFFKNHQLVDADLAILKQLNSLATLSLSGTEISNGGLVHLGALSKLRSLELDDTQISDAGMIHLAGLTNLTQLSLAGTKITDVGLETLRGLTSSDY